jgi:hypothetical protein
MTLDSFVSFAEIGAAVGVIATLAYLSSQINQTNRIAKSSVVSDLMQKYNDFLNIVLTNPEIAELAARLTDPDYVAQSEAEKQQITVFANSLMSIWFSAESSYDQGQIEPGLYQIYLADVSARLTQWPAIRKHMRDIAERYPSSTRELPILAPIFENLDDAPT